MWLLGKFHIHPNAYYNHLKHRKAGRKERKQLVLAKIKEIYHKYNGVPGYRKMKAYLEKEGIFVSETTVHKYMKELGLKSVTRRKKPAYAAGKANKVFENKLDRQFTVKHRNRVWCIDFTYVYITGGGVRYTCVIIDLYDRSIVAVITDRRMTSALAIRTLTKALESNPDARGHVLLHSDQGSQFTSKEFTSFCAKEHIEQSMSHAGCPYDNSVCERVMNSLKQELMGVRTFKTEEELYAGIEQFAYVYYNHERPNSANGGLTPFEARWRRESETDEPEGSVFAGSETKGNEEETEGTTYHSVSDE